MLETRSNNEDLIIVHGAARGADMICDQVCGKLGVRRIAVHAEWRRFGRGAGFIRNQQMLDDHNDIKKVFASKVGNRYGTEDMIRRAKRRGIPVFVTQG